MFNKWLTISVSTISIDNRFQQYILLQANGNYISISCASFFLSIFSSASLCITTDDARQRVL